MRAYAGVFNAVEGNTTFYAVPNATTVARWVEQTPESFRFVMKAPRLVTHERRLRDVGRLLDDFCRALEPLGPRLGGITLQLPPSLGPDDLPALDDVLARGSRAVRWSVEPRHRAFFEGRGMAQLHDVLERHGCERVLLDVSPLHAAPTTTEEGDEERRQKPRVPRLEVALGEFPIVRVIGHDDPAHTDSGLARWEPAVLRWLTEGRTPTIYVHTPSNLDTPAHATAFHRRMCELDPSIAPPSAEPPTSLF